MVAVSHNKFWSKKGKKYRMAQKQIPASGWICYLVRNWQVSWNKGDNYNISPRRYFLKHHVRKLTANAHQWSMTKLETKQSIAAVVLNVFLSFILNDSLILSSELNGSIFFILLALKKKKMTEYTNFFLNCLKGGRIAFGIKRVCGTHRTCDFIFSDHPLGAVIPWCFFCFVLGVFARGCT